MTFSKYDVLGLKKTATLEEIKGAYRTQSKKWHPDKNPDKVEEATKKIQEINDAYKVLSDDRKRQIYNQVGDEGIDQAETNTTNPFDMMNMFRQTGPKRSPPVLHRAEITLPELYTGTLHKFRIMIRMDCSACDGTGSASKKKRECATCNGSGNITRVFRQGPMVQRTQTTCNQCRGTGKKADRTDVCLICKGDETVEVEKKMEFKICPGMSWGMKMVLSGEGHQLRDHVKGDLVIELVLKKEKPIAAPSPTLRRSGDNLEVVLQISLATALLGLQYPLTHLDGKCLMLTCNDIIKPDTIKRVRGAGMPIFSQEHIESPPKEENRRFGDLIIHFDIKFPDALSLDARNKLNEILDSSLEKTLAKKTTKSMVGCKEPVLETITENYGERYKTKQKRYDDEINEGVDIEPEEFPGMRMHHESTMPGGVQCAQQ